MSNIEKAKELLEWLVNESGVTSYRIKRDTGVAETTARRLLIGESKIDNLPLGTARKLEKLAIKLKEEEERVSKEIQGAILLYKRGKLNLDESQDPDFHGLNGETYIIHPLDTSDLELVFAEREGYDPETVNDYADRFDYDKVVGYRKDAGEIVWL